jgi:hypothetical protein
VHITSVKGFGDTENRSIRSLEIFEGFLYAVTYNATSGMEVWRTQDGTSWVQVNIDGFGDSQNRFPHFDNSVTAYKNKLYVGTWNRASGGELWQSLRQIYYLPIVIH